MKILHLTLKKKWFDLIAQGKKKIEYREYKQYWFSRLVKNAGIVLIMHVFDEIHFRNGYNKTSPFMRVQHVITDIEDNKFLIRLGKVLEIANWVNPCQKNKAETAVEQPATNQGQNA